MKTYKIEEFLEKKNIKPNNIELYQTALTHSTYSNENKNVESYEMLEWLGDSIIQSKSSIIILKHFKKEGMNPGKATSIRSQNVKNSTLGEITKQLKLTSV